MEAVSFDKFLLLISLMFIVGFFFGWLFASFSAESEIVGKQEEINRLRRLIKLKTVYQPLAGTGRSRGDE